MSEMTLEQLESLRDSVLDIIGGECSSGAYNAVSQAFDLAEADIATPKKMVTDEMIREACFAYVSTDTVPAEWKPSVDDIRRMTYAANFLYARLAHPVAAKVPEELPRNGVTVREHEYNAGWNDCREVMLSHMNESQPNLQAAQPVNDAAFATMALGYMGRKGITSLFWGDMAALSQTHPQAAQGGGAQGDRCKHGVRYPHPCRECEDAPMSDELREFIEGMTVSVDVSTGEHDAGHRLFGTIAEVMDYTGGGDKHGVTLLVNDAKPNFDVPMPYTHYAGRAAVPDGMVLIRRDELEEVVGDAVKWLTSSAGFDELGSHRDGIVKLYEGLLSAAPQPPEGAGVVDGWQPIETAPKDGSNILLLRGGRCVVGYWDTDKYAKRPKPYWSHDCERIFGTREAKSNPPSHWMPLPAAPTLAGKEKG